MVLDDFLLCAYSDASRVCDSTVQKWGLCPIFGIGDLKMHCGSWGLLHYSSAQECCGWCFGNRSDKPVTDLRAGAALILAGLAADGDTQVYGLHHLNRGYDNLPKKLRSLGANITE